MPIATPAPRAFGSSTRSCSSASCSSSLDAIGHPRRDRRGDDRMIDAGRQRGHDDVDVGRDRIARREVDGLRVGTECLGDLGQLGVVAIGEQQPVDAGRVDELARGAGADRADTDDERGRHRTPQRSTEPRPDTHRNSGPSSSRQPPVVGGTPPLPRTRASIADRAGGTEHEQQALEDLHDAGVYRAPPGLREVTPASIRTPLLRCSACPGAIAQSVRARP